MDKQTKRRIRVLILILSLLLHLFLLFLLFLFYNPDFLGKQQPAQIIYESDKARAQEPLKEQLEYDAAVLAQTPHAQGTRAMEHDEEQDTSPVQQSTTLLSSYVNQLLPRNKEELKGLDAQQETSQQDGLDDDKDAPEHTNEKDQPLRADQQETDSQQEMSDPKKMSDAKRDIAAQQQDKIGPPKRKKRKKRTINTNPQQVAAQNGSSPLPMTFAQLAKGFIQSTTKERGAIPTHVLSMEELARQQYANKVWSILRQSVNTTKKTVLLQKDITTKATLNVVISKNGTLLKAEFRYCQKSDELDKIELVLNDAARTAGLYPPIPQQFGVDTISLQFPLEIRGHQGYHSYELRYN